MNSQTYPNNVYSVNSGTTSTSPFVEFFSDRDPTIYDVNFPVQKRWFNTVNEIEFILTGFTSFNGVTRALWVPLISSSSGGGLIWEEIFSISKTMEVNHGYVTNNALGVIYALPSTAILGDTIKVVGKNGISTVLINAGQSIVFGSNSGGAIIATTSITGLKLTDCVELICTTAGESAVFTVDESQGNWSII